MPAAASKADRPAPWDPRQAAVDSAPLACPLYSGHLLKLGSNDRWQSRLFTFDGSELACVGKKPKAPVIMTYDPHVSSPFTTPTCNNNIHHHNNTLHPMNPNTKWFISLSSVTSIKLLPSFRSFRCFPSKDGAKALSIQTSDGKNLLLRATKDVELERWYFVLSKIWEYQMRLDNNGAAVIAAATGGDQEGRGGEEGTAGKEISGGAGADGSTGLGSKPEQGEEVHGARHLTAHQQSTQLFQKYLEKQYHQDEQGCLGLEEQQPPQQHQTQSQQHQTQPQQHQTQPQQRRPQPQPLQQQQHQTQPQQQRPQPQPVQQQQQHQPQKQSFYHLRPIQKRPRESFLNYQIPPPPRVSAFLPQGFDWSLQEQGDEDDLPMMFGSASFLHQEQESQSLTNERERRPLERQQTWNHPQQQQQQQQPQTANGDMTRSLSTGMTPQKCRVVPGSSSMEPGKAAIIDHWRRSLLCPPLLEDSTALAGDRKHHKRKSSGLLETTDQNNMVVEDPLFESDDHRTDSRDLESTLKHSSIGLEYGLLLAENANDSATNQRHINKNRQARSSLSSDEDSVKDQGHLYGRDHRIYRGQLRYGHLPGLDMQGEHRNDGLHQRNHSLLSNNNNGTQAGREEDELPLGILQMNRHSRWLNTQLSSEDGASRINGETTARLPSSSPKPTITDSLHPHALLPSVPITPKQSSTAVKTVVKSSILHQGMSADQQSFGIALMTPSLSNPSLNFQDPSDCHVLIDDPDSVSTSMSINDPSRPLVATAAVKSTTTGGTTSRTLHRCPSVPLPSSASFNVTNKLPITTTNIPITDQSKKYLAIDTNPHTNVSTSNANHPQPPSRPVRPPGTLMSSLNSPEDDEIPSLAVAQPPSKQGPSVSAATYWRQQSSRSIPHFPSLNPAVHHQKLKSSSSHSIRPTISNPIPIVTPRDLMQRDLAELEKQEQEEDDEPLAVTFSRQQSWKQQRQSPYSTHQLARQQSTGGQKPSSDQQQQQQLAMGASSESFSYF